MPGENESGKDIEQEGQEKEQNKEKAVTLESLAETVASIPEMIKAVKEENAQEVSNILKQVQDDKNLVAADMQNLLSLLGGLADSEKKPTEDEVSEQISTKDGIEKLIDERVDKAKKSEQDKLSVEQKAYFTEYAEYTQDLLGEEFGPDNKPLSSEARKGIMELLKTTIIDKYSDNGVKDASKNFRKASRVYFGQDKIHGFKGSSVEGTGQGGGKEQGAESSAKKRTYSDATKEFFKQIGVSEDWADKKVAAREEAAV